MKNAECANIDEGNRVTNLNQIGARSIYVKCPADECDNESEAEDWQ